MVKLKLHARYSKAPDGISLVPQKNEKTSKILRKFEEYQSTYYKKVKINCVCGREDSYQISSRCREGFYFPISICRSCGLIKAMSYWDDSSVSDYYANWYRKIYDFEEATESNPERFYQGQARHSKKLKKYINEFTDKLKQPYAIFDVGGAAGGVMDAFKSEADRYLFDFNKKILFSAEKRGINTVEGGLESLGKVDKKPDLIILSHVLEHIVDIDRALEDLSHGSKIGTLLYIELPGIDSLKLGRRNFDFLGDIHKPHVTYFSLKVLENLLARYGFKVLKSNSIIEAIFEYTGERSDLVNFHDDTVSDIKSAEFRRKLGFSRIKNVLSKIFPKNIISFIKDIRGW